MRRFGGIGQLAPQIKLVADRSRSRETAGFTAVGTAQFPADTQAASDIGAGQPVALGHLRLQKRLAQGERCGGQIEIVVLHRLDKLIQLRII